MFKKTSKWCFFVVYFFSGTMFSRILSSICRDISSQWQSQDLEGVKVLHFHINKSELKCIEYLAKTMI